MLALDRSGSATNYLPSTILHFTFVQTLIENPLSCKTWGWVGERVDMGGWELGREENYRKMQYLCNNLQCKKCPDPNQY